MKYLVGILILVSAFSVNAATQFTSEIFKKGSNRTEKLYSVTYKFDTAGSDEVRTFEYFDPKGVLALREITSLKNGKVTKVVVEQKQINQVGTIEVADAKLVFTVEESGKKKSSSEKFKEPFLVPANLQDFVSANWEEIDKGKTFDFRWGVWFRKETVGFEFTKIGDEQEGAEQVMVVRMKPSSWLIAKLVDPIIFKFNRSTKRLSSFIGRVAPKQAVGGDYKDLDGEVVYKY
jgi:hypothetical protein